MKKEKDRKQMTKLFRAAMAMLLLALTFVLMPRNSINACAEDYPHAELKEQVKLALANEEYSLNTEGYNLQVSEVGDFGDRVRQEVPELFYIHPQLNYWQF